MGPRSALENNIVYRYETTIKWVYKLIIGEWVDQHREHVFYKVFFLSRADIRFSAFLRFAQDFAILTITFVVIDVTLFCTILGGRPC